MAHPKTTYLAVKRGMLACGACQAGLRPQSPGWRLYGRVSFVVADQAASAPEGADSRDLTGCDKFRQLERCESAILSSCHPICNTALGLFAPWCSCTRSIFADSSTLEAGLGELSYYSSFRSRRNVQRIAAGRIAALIRTISRAAQPVLYLSRDSAPRAGRS
jgi:hypothetical protein